MFLTEPVPPDSRCQVVLIGNDGSADSLVGKDLQQQAVGHAAVQDVYSADTVLDGGGTVVQLGFNALKTVKYVYRGEEKILDKTTQDNLQKTKDLLSAIQ